MKLIDVVAAVLVVVGALNWGLVAVARFDLVAALFGLSFGEVSALTAVVYGLVGVAGLYQALFWKRVHGVDAAGRPPRVTRQSVRSFAPTDEAFAQLPAGTLESLLKPENKDKLRRVLTYHVVVDDANVTTTDIQASNGVIHVIDTLLPKGV